MTQKEIFSLLPPNFSPFTIFWSTWDVSPFQSTSWQRPYCYSVRQRPISLSPTKCGHNWPTDHILKIPVSWPTDILPFHFHFQSSNRQRTKTMFWDDLATKSWEFLYPAILSNLWPYWILYISARDMVKLALSSIHAQIQKGKWLVYIGSNAPSKHTLGS